MSIFSERLIALIEYAKQTALLKKKPVLNISQHREFVRVEDRFKGLPGISFNHHEAEFEEVWMRIERLHESRPPFPENKLLGCWIEFAKSPEIKPTLKSHALRKALIEIGALQTPKTNAEQSPPDINAQQSVSELIALDEFPEKAIIETQLKAFIEVVWRSWAEKETQVRKCISLYSEMFMLSQKMQGNLVDTQLELVWGIGMSIWTRPEGALSYPLISQLVELSLDEKTMALEIRPRSSEPRLELDAYAAMANPGLPNVVATATRFFESTGVGFNPFEPSTFEPLLQSAVTFLDSKGIYWPRMTTKDDRSLPKAGDHLQITDTWVLMARPRANNLFIQDLERFETVLSAEKEVVLFPALKALVSEPSSELTEEELPAFRGLSSSSGSSAGQSSRKVAELYFPKPYNDEQVQIAQMLEAHDGVIVQGPPGTGKTHTIANVICHYLASGKRVLVTSMKDPALTVLQEKLPESIRPLAISLLTSESEGMKQFEFAINKISSEVTRIDKAAYRRDIEQIDGQIDALHGSIAKTDREIANWATLNLDKINIDDEELTPIDVAVIVAANRMEMEWFPDNLTIDNTHRPQFTNSDISALRDARRILGADIKYIGVKLPVIDEFPGTATLLQVHRDLSRLSELSKREDEGGVPSLINSARETITAAMDAASKISNLRLLLQEIENSHQTWTDVLKQYLLGNDRNEILNLYRSLKEEIHSALETRKQFLVRPVTLPEGLEETPNLLTAIENLSLNRSPFGIAGLFGKGEQKRLVDSVRVVGNKPASTADWTHALLFIRYRQQCKMLLVRWNSLADEIPIPRMEIRPEQLNTTRDAIDVFSKVTQSIADSEDVKKSIQFLLPMWSTNSKSFNAKADLSEAEDILNHYLTRYRLAGTWEMKETFLHPLSGCGGEITNQLRVFINDRLGTSDVSDAEIQASWASLMEELRRIFGLANRFQSVSDVTRQIMDSGAVRWSEALMTQICPGAHDALLPDNWSEVWRLSRLVNFVEKIDCRNELKRLSQLRSEMEHDLSTLYMQSVEKRTWLKLAENATHEVRAALEAYRSAIKKIGKGTGIRAGRYRQDARFAAELANGAIPCWIMPHYRICESLPASLGCFDLVIIDEASQSDLTALPAILRAKKILVVGDDQQVSPEGVGLEEEKIRNLMTRFLSGQVAIYRPQMTPDRSIYDLFKVVFSKSAVMLREHFRCAGPIIEYSKREFYGHQLLPLRLPKVTERLDPPLVDVYIVDGYRKGDINIPEAMFIVDEIKQIANNPKLQNRTIGVVSLIGNEQALKVMQILGEELGEEVMTRFKITCGDARTFQGKERDIMFLSMIASPGQAHAQTQDMIGQRFNVAASRARDRMYLVRSIQLEELSSKDLLRSKLIQHFQAPFLQNESEINDKRGLCESPFEREIYDLLIERGYRVIPQVPVGSFRIDMVVEGETDSRLAIECDGDRYHGPDKWDSDMRRQRILERAGWKFWRCFASTFVLRRSEVVADLIETLEAHGIQPSSSKSPLSSIHVESRKIISNQNIDLISQPPETVSQITDPNKFSISSSNLLAEENLLKYPSSDVNNASRNSASLGSNVSNPANGVENVIVLTRY